ncbi:LysR family transcriptional regulator substrate-binding protein [Streptomyces sp. NPDC059605]|uniref:LysR family transcriptional regulator substrate-binding protein n=1 Tax=unclassified Streptomyces TaxID=2593676 RepID=UPI003682C4CD
MNLDAVTLSKKNAAQAAQAVLDGTVDVSFRALPTDRVPAGINAERLLDGPLELLVGPGHPLADAPRVRPADLAGHRYMWPQTHDLRRIPLREPTPVHTRAAVPNRGQTPRADRAAQPSAHFEAAHPGRRVGTGLDGPLTGRPIRRTRPGGVVAKREAFDTSWWFPRTGSVPEPPARSASRTRATDGPEPRRGRPLDGHPVSDCVPVTERSARRSASSVPGRAV